MGGVWGVAGGVGVGWVGGFVGGGGGVRRPEGVGGGVNCLLSCGGGIYSRNLSLGPHGPCLYSKPTAYL